MGRIASVAAAVALIAVAGAVEAKAPAAETLGGRFVSRGRDGVDRPLVLRRFSAEVTTAPGTVRSHVTMEVSATTQEQVEAIIRLPVPRGAAVTRAILWVEGRPMNGMLVDRQRATDIYQSIVAWRCDPALVTWDGPGWIGVSVFPLEKKRPRRFELEWVEPAAVAGGQVRYRVPAVSNGGRLIARADLIVDGRELPRDGRSLIAVGRADASVVAGRAPGDPFHQVLVHARAPAGVPRFVLVAETSAMMTASDRARQRAAIDALGAALPAGAKAAIVAADLDVYVIAEQAPASRWPPALARIDSIPSAAALDLVRALRDAADRARAAGGDAVVFVGRGRDSLGRDLIRTLVPELRAAGVRLFVLDTGSAGEPPWLRDVAQMTGGDALSHQALGAALPSVVRALRPRAVPAALDARATGQWHSLETVTGQPVWITRALDPPAGLATAAASPTDLASLWSRARFASPVLSPTTALLVLETENEYKRYGLTSPEAALEPAPTRVRRVRAPEIMAGAVSIRGSLDKEIIRRVIRRRINQVRYCYEQGLASDHALQGRVILRFIVAPSGRVVATEITSSTLANDGVGSCIAAAARAWQFPAPLGGGFVEVNYPFVLVPSMSK